METQTQSFTVYTGPATQHNQQLAATNQLHASINESSWNTNHLAAQSTPAPSAQPSALFSVVNRPPDLDYPSPASSTTSPSLSQHHHQSENYSNHHHPQSFSLTASNEPMFTQFHPVESSIGPSRVLTRRQRAALAQGSHARRASMPSSFQRPEPHPTSVCPVVYRYYWLAQHRYQHHNSAMYLTPPVETSRPPTPNSEDVDKYTSQRDRLSVNIGSAAPMPLQSPTYHPMTPTSLSSPFSSYQQYDQPRSTPGSNVNNQRSVSPALSNASALTSVSSISGPIPQVSHVYPSFMSSKLPGNVNSGKGKQRKQRLYNVDRKAICLHHQELPTARQEDIAAKFGVERSTISKILKNKTKWLNMPTHETERASKHRSVVLSCLSLS
ncbi:hypothetical protein L208DRAFT_402370 [Tricholoma matsutake]|nr:hypothetical protein L208DRAFT_402370 [Tricholoma matsutake 945]